MATCRKNFIYIRTVHVQTDYKFHCVPEHGSCNGSSIILEACFHWQFKALFFQVRYIELYRETGSNFQVVAGFLCDKSLMAAFMHRVTIKWMHVFGLINKHCLGIVFSLFSFATVIFCRNCVLSWSSFLEQNTT